MYAVWEGRGAEIDAVSWFHKLISLLSLVVSVIFRSKIVPRVDRWVSLVRAGTMPNVILLAS